MENNDCAHVWALKSMMSRLPWEQGAGRQAGRQAGLTAPEVGQWSWFGDEQKRCENVLERWKTTTKMETKMEVKKEEELQQTLGAGNTSYWTEIRTLQLARAKALAGRQAGRP